jgi:LmbE family N-acetylglucosaminyl deacetylase
MALSRILVISAHPDDETLGCGGTILRHVARGDTVHWAIATQAHEPQWDRSTIDRKRNEIERVASDYGLSGYTRLGFPSTQLDRLGRSDLIAAIGEVARTVCPEVVYVVHPGDIHGDHAAVFESTVVALKSFRMQRSGIRRILCFETLSSTEAAPPVPARAFVPSVFHDIGEWFERKLEVMALYASETHDDPLPRSPSAIRALARLRGATVGVKYAEAFWLVRELD